MRISAPSVAAAILIAALIALPFVAAMPANSAATGGTGIMASASTRAR